MGEEVDHLADGLAEGALAEKTAQTARVVAAAGAEAAVDDNEPRLASGRDGAEQVLGDGVEAIHGEVRDILELGPKQTCVEGRRHSAHEGLPPLT